MKCGQYQIKKCGRTPKLDHEKIKKMILAGNSIDEIIKETGCNTRNIRYVRDKYKLKIIKKTPNFDRMNIADYIDTHRYFPRCKKQKEYDFSKVPEYVEKRISDKEIAEIIGCSRERVRNYRYENRILRKNGPAIKINYDDVEKYYLLGYSDFQIADVVGCSRSIVQDWRSKNNLPVSWSNVLGEVKA